MRRQRLAPAFALMFEPQAVALLDTGHSLVKLMQDRNVSKMPNTMRAWHVPQGSNVLFGLSAIAFFAKQYFSY